MIYYFLTLVVVLISSFAQLLLKKGSVDSLKLKKYIFTSPYSIIGYIIFAIAAFLSIFAMIGLELKVFFTLLSLTYICVPILSFVFLKESIPRDKMIGIIIIFIGVMIFNI